MRSLIEAGHALGVRGTAKAAVESVCPGVVAAGQHRYLAAPRLDQAIAPMLAHIVERANFTVATRHHDHALLEDLLGHERPRFAQFIHMRDQVPGFEKDLGLLLLEHGGVVKETRRQGVARLLVRNAPARLVDTHEDFPRRMLSARYGALTGLAC